MFRPETVSVIRRPGGCLHARTRDDATPGAEQETIPSLGGGRDHRDRGCRSRLGSDRASFLGQRPPSRPRREARKAARSERRRIHSREDRQRTSTPRTRRSRPGQRHVRGSRAARAEPHHEGDDGRRQRRLSIAGDDRLLLGHRPDPDRGSRTRCRLLLHRSGGRLLLHPDRPAEPQRRDPDAERSALRLGRLPGAGQHGQLHQGREPPAVGVVRQLDRRQQQSVRGARLHPDDDGTDHLHLLRRRLAGGQPGESGRRHEPRADRMPQRSRAEQLPGDGHSLRLRNSRVERRRPDGPLPSREQGWPRLHAQHAARSVVRGADGSRLRSTLRRRPERRPALPEQQFLQPRQRSGCGLRGLVLHRFRLHRRGQRRTFLHAGVRRRPVPRTLLHRRRDDADVVPGRGHLHGERALPRRHLRAPAQRRG